LRAIAADIAFCPDYVLEPDLKLVDRPSGA
jgi:hypothetical protein